jgi:two-component system sensor kinase FixL
MLGPLIENARLWSELKNRYTRAMDTLRQTEARLIDMERTAAYVRLAQAMAHEIRNPLMAIGGLVKRMAHSGLESQDSNKWQLVTKLVERVEAVLKEVDYFVKLPRPHKKLTKVDSLIQEVISSHNSQLRERAHVHRFLVDTSRLMVPLDAGLFKKALCMILKEFLLSFPKESELKIGIRCPGKELEISIGEMDDNGRLCEVFDGVLL